MATNITSLRTTWASLVGFPEGQLGASSEPTQAQWLRWSTEVEKDALSRTDKLRVKTDTLSTTGGTAEYTAPTDLWGERIIGIRFDQATSTSNNPRRIDYYRLQQIYPNLGNTPTSAPIPRWWSINRATAKIVFYPTPSVSGTDNATVTYIYTPDTHVFSGPVSGETSTSMLPDEWVHDITPVGVAQRYYEYLGDEQRAAFHAQMKEVAIAKMVDEYATPPSSDFRLFRRAGVGGAHFSGR